MVGEYRVEHKLGEGGMAVVYAATHPLIGKKAAIKVLSPILSADAGAVARFVLEARSINRIGHPNIVDVFSFGRLADGRSYFVMEWLQGQTLYERMWHQHGPLPLTEVIHLLSQMCDGLEAAHEKGIIHRDLKPANVFVCHAAGRPDFLKLLDFGVAKLAHQEMMPRWTSAGCVVGTPEYISPEQARGKDVDARTDLYSLGVMAYEMVLGRLPFLSDNPADAIHLHLAATPPKPSILWPQIPPALESLLLRLLAKKPDERATLPEVREVLASLKPTVTPALDRVVDAPPPVRLTKRRHIVRLAAVATTFLALVVAGYRPHRLHANQLGLAPPAASSVAAAGALPVKPASPVAPAALPVIGADLPASPPPRLNQRRAKKSHRDDNYLLDPFAR
ncbi:MAG: serine/threonine protein kinase [Myxococcales bacterium]|nr:serine/threonine protein kinase [Myxococcales bacterium]